MNTLRLHRMIMLLISLYLVSPGGPALYAMKRSASSRSQSLSSQRQGAASSSLLRQPVPPSSESEVEGFEGQASSSQALPVRAGDSSREDIWRIPTPTPTPSPTHSPLPSNTQLGRTSPEHHMPLPSYVSTDNNAWENKCDTSAVYNSSINRPTANNPVKKRYEQSSSSSSSSPIMAGNAENAFSNYPVTANNQNVNVNRNTDINDDDNDDIKNELASIAEEAENVTSQAQLTNAPKFGSRRLSLSTPFSPSRTPTPYGNTRTSLITPGNSTPQDNSAELLKNPIGLPFLQRLIERELPLCSQMYVPSGTNNQTEQEQRQKNVQALYRLLKNENKFTKKIYADFLDVAQAFATVMKNDRLPDNVQQWHNNQQPPATLFSLEHSTFIPYIEKKRFPNDSTVGLIGDLHSGFHSLVAILEDLYKKGCIDEQLKIIQKDYYLGFLGDFVDRGLYGVETMYLIMLFKIRNSHNDSVFFTRGNHEDVAMNNRDGFLREAEQKLTNDDKTIIGTNVDLQNLIAGIYNLFPVAASLENRDKPGERGIVCHGGLDIGCYKLRKFFQNSNLAIRFDMITDEKFNPTKLINHLSDQQKTAVVNAIIKSTWEDYEAQAHHILGEEKAKIDDETIKMGQRMFAVGNLFWKMHAAFSDQHCDEKKLNQFKNCFSQAFVNAGTLYETLADRTPNKQIVCYLPDINGLKSVNRKYRVLLQCLNRYERHFASHPSHPFILGTDIMAELLTLMQNDMNAETDVCLNRLKNTPNYTNYEPIKKHLDFLEDNDGEIQELVYQLITGEKIAQDAISEEMRQIFLSPDSFLYSFCSRHIGHRPHSLEGFGFCWSDVAFAFRDVGINKHDADFGTNVDRYDNNAQHDFVCDSNNPCRCAYGKTITEEIFQLQGISFMIRAHQHYELMMQGLNKYGGLVGLFNNNNSSSSSSSSSTGIFDNTLDTLPICKNAVYTLSVAGASGMLGDDRLGDHPYAELHINGDSITDWTLTKCCKTSPKK